MDWRSVDQHTLNPTWNEKDRSMVTSQDGNDDTLPNEQIESSSPAGSVSDRRLGYGSPESSLYRNTTKSPLRGVTKPSAATSKLKQTSRSTNDLLRLLSKMPHVARHEPKDRGATPSSPRATSPRGQETKTETWRSVYASPSATLSPLERFRQFQQRLNAIKRHDSPPVADPPVDFSFRRRRDRHHVHNDYEDALSVISYNSDTNFTRLDFSSSGPEPSALEEEALSLDLDQLDFETPTRSLSQGWQPPISSADGSLPDFDAEEDMLDLLPDTQISVPQPSASPGPSRPRLQQESHMEMEETHAVTPATRDLNEHISEWVADIVPATPIREETPFDTLHEKEQPKQPLSPSDPWFEETEEHPEIDNVQIRSQKTHAGETLQRSVSVPLVHVDEIDNGRTATAAEDMLPVDQVMDQVAATPPRSNAGSGFEYDFDDLMENVGSVDISDMIMEESSATAAKRPMTREIRSEPRIKPGDTFVRRRRKENSEREDTNSAARSGPGIGLPLALRNGLFATYTDGLLDASGKAKLSEVTELFFEQLADDLNTYSNHAGRDEILFEDMILLMQRQKFITDKVSLESLAHENLPRELWDKLCVSAVANNNLYPE